MLLAQADSGVCGAGAAVEAFARYEYCGAVTHYGVAWAPTQNGGFSIRNVGCMRRVSRDARGTPPRGDGGAILPGRDRCRRRGAGAVTGQSA